jgi:hypothetical protein
VLYHHGVAPRSWLLGAESRAWRDRLDLERDPLGRFAVAAQCGEHGLAGRRGDRPELLPDLSRQPARVVTEIALSRPFVRPSSRLGARSASW